MDHAVVPISAPFDGTIPVPGSKSIWQRALVLAALADAGTRIRAPAGPRAEDVECLEAALRTLGRWDDGALGRSREHRRLDLGVNGTGFRFAVALAALRPSGGRTLVTGRPVLLGRPHRPLLRALGRLGVDCKRRSSGAVRVLGGGFSTNAVDVDARASSQFASALMLMAPRVGGLTLRLPHPPVSAAYLRVTAAALEAFGIDAALEGLDAPGGRIVVPSGTPRAAEVTVEPDASSAAVWWTAAALTGGRVAVAGIDAESPQADVAVLDLLQRAGATVESGPEGVTVAGPDTVRPAGDVDLRASPDLLPLVAVLAARAHGETRIRGVAHARGKESDRIATVGAGLSAVGAAVEEMPDGLRIRGGPLRGADVDVAGDHRIAFAFGILGLAVPGIRLRGAEAASKSDPGFLAGLRAFATGDPTP